MIAMKEPSRSEPREDVIRCEMSTRSKLLLSIGPKKADAGCVKNR